MFGLTKKETYMWLAVLAVVLCVPVEAYAAFGSLIGSGQTIFTGLRKIIYPASAIGIICVCIGGFFGNMNWKWLMATVVGLLVIALCGGFIEMFAGNKGGISDLDVMSGM